MPIEFRCTHCNRLLRTPDETAGKQAQCPECGAITTIPSVSTAAPLGSAPQSPFAPGQPASGAPWPPQQADELAHATARSYASRRVAGPAIVLIVLAALGIAWQLFFFAQLARKGADAVLSDEVRQMQPVQDLLAQNPDMERWMVPGSAISAGVTLVISIVMLLGALSMKNLHSFGFAMVAAVLALIPCATPCCCLPLPFGIWALVVLNDPSVKAAFRR
jgi:phage FluMu protein Com